MAEFPNTAAGEGPEGPIGPAGADGPPGSAGAQGPKGEKGDKGDTGAAGSQGVKGDTGAAGAIGSQGPQGVKGDTGATGAEGPKGSTGVQGIQGLEGPIGPVGPSGGMGFPSTVDLRNIRAGDAQSIGSSNNCTYIRCSEGGTITKVGLEIATASGNISIAVYRNTGVGRAARPGERLATTGAIACPAAGFREVALGKSVTMNAGDWLAISCDNLTATFRTLLTTSALSELGAGIQHSQVTAHPAPETPSGMNATIGRNIVMVGIA